MAISDPIVKVVRPSRRKCYVLRYRPPHSRTWKERSTGTTSRRQAELQAQALQDSLQEGVSREVLFPYFCDRYYREVVVHWKRPDAWEWTQRLIEESTRIETVDQINGPWLHRLAEKLRREKGYRDETIRTHLSRLRAALKWGESVGLVARCPRFPTWRRTEGRSATARSRPVSEAEFALILEATKAERPDDWPIWQRFLRGLWHSGFRVQELARVTWDLGQPWCIDHVGDRPMIRVTAETEKAGRDRLQPVTREFWSLCCETPEHERSGLVFLIPGAAGGQMTIKRIVRVISAIGRRANVVTDAHRGKTATSHDIGRRAFATRMGEVLSIQDLTTWMRLSSPSTTMRYYYQPQAVELANRIWESEKTGGKNGCH